MIVFIITILMFKSGQPYKAAVFQYHPEKVEGKPEYTMLRNLEVYKTQVENAKDKGVDIIVFPEYGLTTLYADPKEYAVEITNENNIIKELKAAAIEHNMYIVANLLEKEKKTKNQSEYYNTNLVFDRAGNITAKYRKVSLSQNERKNNISQGNETVTFTTNFGITFALFTLSDILLGKFTQEILNTSVELSDIIYLTAWKSYLPFYVSLSLQHGYAIANGVNLLAASYDYPEEGYGGSSIINANGASAKFHFSSKLGNRLIVEEINKLVERREPTTCQSPGKQNLYEKLEEKPDFNTSSLQFFDSINVTNRIPLNGSLQTICNKEKSFCCNFSSTYEHHTTGGYMLEIYDGKDVDIDIHIRTCLLTCNSATSSNYCNTKIDIKVTRIFERDEGSFHMPVTLRQNLEPITGSTYCINKTNNTSEIKLSTLGPQRGISVFGIMELRSGDKNGETPKDSASVDWVIYNNYWCWFCFWLYYFY